MAFFIIPLLTVLVKSVSGMPHDLQNLQRFEIPVYVTPPEFLNQTDKLFLYLC